MLNYISGKEIKDFPLADDIWRFRHRHFVETYGWEALRKADGREIDQFDRDDALHLVLVDHNEVIGYTRLLPTLQPHLLSDVYPHLTQGNDYPKGRRIYEWTRCAADRDVKIAGVTASGMLMTGVMEFCLCAGITNLIVETHPRLVNWLMTTGWDIMPFAAPSIISDCPVLPIECKPSLQGLAMHHDQYGVDGSVLNFDRHAVNPVTGSAFEHVLNHAHGDAARGMRYAAG